MDRLLYEGDTKFAHYQVVDTVYLGRKSRILFSGFRAAAQSGVAMDNQPDLLFDYIQRFLELTKSLQPKQLLIIGGGAYTLPMSTLRVVPNITIDVIEPDVGLDKIAQDFFGLKPDKRLNIIHASGEDYLKNCKKSYELILVDAFIHNVIPHELSDKKTIKRLYKFLAPNGVVATNIISAYRGIGSGVIKEHYRTYSTVFDSTKVFPADKGIPEWISQNFLLIGQKGEQKKDYGLRFGAMPS